MLLGRTSASDAVDMLANTDYDSYFIIDKSKAMWLSDSRQDQIRKLHLKNLRSGKVRAVTGLCSRQLDDLPATKSNKAQTYCNRSGEKAKPVNRSKIPENPRFN